MKLPQFHRSFALCGILGLLLGLGLQAEVDPAVRSRIAGDALLEENAYQLLEHLSDSYGPRMIGSQGHANAMDYLEKALRELGIETQRQVFDFPGWLRGEASVSILAPVERKMRAVALGYVDGRSDIEGSIEYIDTKDVAAILENTLEGKVLLLKQNITFTQEELESFAESGAVAALLINRVNGGQLLARTANHHGEKPPFPLLSITQEEGLWMRRLVEDGERVEVKIRTRADIQQMKGQNLIARLPGTSGEKVIMGGHFDSWDLGQGAIDNGLGVVQIYEAARLLSKLSPDNRHTVEFVWFDAEEFGLWGSKRYVEDMDRDAIRVMVNLDMVGEPLALNAMGFDSIVPQLEAFSNGIGSWTFEKRVANKTWLGSDHHPFILKGVPAVTFNAPLDHDDVRYYHDYADTFDKIDRAMLGRASAIITLLMYELSNDDSSIPPRLTSEETKTLFQKAGLEDRMRRAGQWPF